MPLPKLLIINIVLYEFDFDIVDWLWIEPESERWSNITVTAYWFCVFETA